MTTTTNLGLTKDDPSERYSVIRVNDNSDRVDNFAGETRAGIADLQTAVAGKQNTLVAGVNMDSTPTSGHGTVPVTSGGVYTALSGKQDTLTVGTNLDTAPTADSENPITSGGVYTYTVIGQTITASNTNHADLNDYKTPGVYRSTSGTITTYIDHRPDNTYGDVSGRGFRLVVEYVGATTYVRQTLIPAWNANQPDKYFMRHYRDPGTSTPDARHGWSNWHVYEGTDTGS